MSKIIIIGPAYPLRGGLASFNERLARAFMSQGHEVIIYTFSLQYPSLLFPGKTQLSESPPPDDLTIRVCINSIHPLNWIRVGKKLAAERADFVVVRYWLPFLAPCLGTILRTMRKKASTRIFALVDNALPHEKRPGDNLFTRYLTSAVDAFFTMSQKVAKDLSLFTTMPIHILHHPLYDHFGNKRGKTEARKYLHIPESAFVYLFFGFIRKYKGLDMLIHAFEKLVDENKGQAKPILVIAGEFYAGESEIRETIAASRVKNDILLFSDFIRDEEVAWFFGAADCVVQPYRNATQSGVTPLAYHFETPMIVTNVGALPDMVPEGIGLICEPDSESVSRAMEEIQYLDLQTFHARMLLEKKKYSWESFIQAILNVADKLKNHG